MVYKYACPIRMGNSFYKLFKIAIIDVKLFNIQTNKIALPNEYLLDPYFTEEKVELPKGPYIYYIDNNGKKYKYTVSNDSWNVI